MFLGSGSSYIYGFCDKHFKKGMTREEAQDFVSQGAYHNNSDELSLILALFV